MRKGWGYFSGEKRELGLTDRFGICRPIPAEVIKLSGARQHNFLISVNPAVGCVPSSSVSCNSQGVPGPGEEVLSFCQLPNLIRGLLFSPPIAEVGRDVIPGTGGDTGPRVEIRQPALHEHRCDQELLGLPSARDVR